MTRFECDKEGSAVKLVLRGNLRAICTDACLFLNQVHAALKRECGEEVADKYRYFIRKAVKEDIVFSEDARKKKKQEQEQEDDAFSLEDMDKMLEKANAIIDKLKELKE